MVGWQEDRQAEFVGWFADQEAVFEVEEVKKPLIERSIGGAPAARTARPLPTVVMTGRGLAVLVSR